MLRLGILFILSSFSLIHASAGQKGIAGNASCAHEATQSQHKSAADDSQAPATAAASPHAAGHSLIAPKSVSDSEARQLIQDETLDVRGVRGIKCGIKKIHYTNNLDGMHLDRTVEISDDTIGYEISFPDETSDQNKLSMLMRMYTLEQERIRTVLRQKFPTQYIAFNNDRRVTNNIANVPLGSNKELSSDSESCEMTIKNFKKNNYGMQRSQLVGLVSKRMLTIYDEYLEDDSGNVIVVSRAVHNGFASDKLIFDYLAHVLSSRESFIKSMMAAGFTPTERNAFLDVVMYGSYVTHSKTSIAQQHDDEYVQQDSNPKSKNYKLLAAARSNKVENVRAALADKPDINAADSQWNTAFIIAAQLGNVPMGKLLKAHNACLTLSTVQGKTALEIAFAHNKEKFLKFLLDSGVSVDSENELGETLLHVCAFNKNSEMTRWLLNKRGANMHYRSSQFNVPLFDRIKAFATLDSEFEPIHILFQAELLSREAAQKEEMRKQQNVNDDEKLKLEKLLDKKNKVQAPRQTDSPETEAERERWIALQKAQEEELMKADRVRQEVEKAERIARHEKNLKDKEVAQAAQKADVQKADKDTAATGSAAGAAENAAGIKKPEGRCMGFVCEYSKDAQAQKDMLPPERSKKLFEELEELIKGHIDPEKLKHGDEFKIKMGNDYRALYTIDWQNKKIMVIKVGPRENFYKK